MTRAKRTTMSDEDIDDLDFSETVFDSGKIRNPDRIEPICEALEQRWKESPDMRLGQLVSVLTGQGQTFAVEDTEVMDELGVEFDGAFWADKEDNND